MKNLKDYKGILPYASELFGVYQPLLGWRSAIIKDRYNRFQSKLYSEIAQPVLTATLDAMSLSVNDDQQGDDDVDGIFIKPVDYLKSTELFIHPEYR